MSPRLSLLRILLNAALVCASLEAILPAQAQAGSLGGDMALPPMATKPVQETRSYAPRTLVTPDLSPSSQPQSKDTSPSTLSSIGHWMKDMIPGHRDKDADKPMPAGLAAAAPITPVAPETVTALPTPPVTVVSAAPPTPVTASDKVSPATNPSALPSPGLLSTPPVEAAQQVPTPSKIATFSSPGAIISREQMHLVNPQPDAKMTSIIPPVDPVHLAAMKPAAGGDAMDTPLIPLSDSSPADAPTESADSQTLPPLPSDAPLAPQVANPAPTPPETASAPAFTPPAADPVPVIVPAVSEMPAIVSAPLPPPQPATPIAPLADTTPAPSPAPVASATTTGLPPGVPEDAIVRAPDPVVPGASVTATDTTMPTAPLVAPAPIVEAPPADMTPLAMPGDVPAIVPDTKDATEPKKELSQASKKVLEKLPPAPKQKKKFSEEIDIDHAKDLKAIDQPAQIEATHEAMGVKIEVKRPPVNLNYELEKAYNALLAGHTEEAIGIYKTVLDNDSKNKNALFGIATAYHRTGQIDQARPYYARLLAIDPNNKDGLNNFLLLLADEAPEDALSQLGELQRANPMTSSIPAQMAVIYEKLGQPEMASEKMVQALELAPENITYRYNLAIILDKQKKYDEAIPLYRQVVQAYQRGETIPGNIQKIQQRLTFIGSNRP